MTWELITFNYKFLIFNKILKLKYYCHFFIRLRPATAGLRSPFRGLVPGKSLFYSYITFWRSSKSDIWIFSRAYSLAKYPYHFCTCLPRRRWRPVLTKVGNTESIPKNPLKMEVLDPPDGHQGNDSKPVSPNYVIAFLIIHRLDLTIIFICVNVLIRWYKINQS